jgi:hypothetical protein
LVFGPAVSLLVAAGLLARIQDSASATCEECDHEGDVVVFADKGIALLSCPYCGTQNVRPESLRRWEVRVDGVLAALTKWTKDRHKAAEAVPRALWYIGRVNWDSRSRELLFVRPLDAVSAAAVSAYLGGHRGAIVVTTTERVLHASGEQWPLRRLALASVVSLDESGLELDQDAIASRASEWREAHPVRTRKPLPKRKSREANILKLLNAMADHLMIARQYAWATKEATGCPKLWPRPTEETLGKPFGLDKSAVSKCINDTSAGLLKYFWDLAVDLDKVMQFRDPRQRKKDDD